MIPNIERVLQDFSSIEEKYTPDYREYKRKLLRDLTQLPPPSFRQEYWKNINLDFLDQEWHYTEFNNIRDDRIIKDYIGNLIGSNNYINLVFLNGFLYSTDNNAQDALRVERVEGDYGGLLHKKKEIFSFFQNKDLLKNWFLNLNEILNDEVIIVKLANGGRLKRPVRIVFISDNDTLYPVTSPQIFFHLGKRSELDLIEEHFSLGRSLNNHSLKFILEEQASVHHFLFQNESTSAAHINHTYVEQKQESSYYSYILQKGAGNSIVQKTIRLIEPRSKCELYGLSSPQGQQNFSNLTTVEHMAPETRSQQLYRGILDDEAFLNFSGNVRVFQSAPLSDSGQLNQNLILDKNATAISRPRLEIYNDNVKCTHGATFRDVNPEEMFYLLARGISPKNCKELLINGFAQEFYNQIHDLFPDWKP